MNISTTKGLIVVALAAGLVAFFAMQKEGNLEPVSVVQENETVQSAELGDVVDTSDWIEYRNEDKGFTLMYPPEWVAVPLASNFGGIVKFVGESVQKQIENGEVVGPSVDSVVISYWDNINTSGARGGSWSGMWEYKDLADYFTDPRALNNKIGNISGVTWSGYEVIIGGHGSLYGVMIERGGIWQLVFAADDKMSMSKEAKGVLSTFEFVEPVSASDML